ncbi:MAG: CRISPR-associated CARF protein Csx1, partial [Candidatus Bathyarchaeia archaeon]
MQTLIISVWGNPKGWEPVKYAVEKKIDKESIELYQVEKEYKSTLGALMEAYPDAYVLLFVSSTLGTLSSNRSYSEILREVSSNVRENYLKNPDYCTDHKRVSLKVLPGVGRFKDNNIEKTFKGKIDAFRVAAFICSYEEIVKTNPDRVILDISHGINYMPVYLRMSVYSAFLGFLALVNHQAEWHVYNSEPKEKGVNELEIMLIEDSRIKPEFAIHSLYREFETLFDVNFKLIKSSFSKIPPECSHQWEELNRKTIRLIKSAENGLIIPFIKTAQDLANTETKPLESDLRKYSYLENCDGIVDICGNELRYLYAPNILSTYIMAIVNSIKRVRNMGIDTFDGGYCISDLKKIAEGFVEKPALTIVKNEISQIEDRIELSKLAEAESAGIKFNV